MSLELLRKLIQEAEEHGLLADFRLYAEGLQCRLRRPGGRVLQHSWFWRQLDSMHDGIRDVLFTADVRRGIRTILAEKD